MDLLIEGYASLFGVDDPAGDVVRVRRGKLTRLREDGRGLFVRELASDATLAGRTARKLIA